jgi:hypothetical protein
MKCKVLILAMLVTLAVASQSAAATYYMRADGTAQSKAAATGSASTTNAGNTASAMIQTLPSTNGEQLKILDIAKGAMQIDFGPQVVSVEVF